MRAARRQADEEKQEEMRLARESAEFAQDPDAADSALWILEEDL